MRIESDVKLDYNNVLIRPKRSTLGSRKEVDLSRKFKFRNYGGGFDLGQYDYEGVPIMAANMDGVGTFEMAETLAKKKMFTCLAKSYTGDDIINWLNTSTNNIADISDYFAYSMGIVEQDLDKFDYVYSSYPEMIKYVCVDVANGYSERFVDFIRNLRKEYPNIVIIAGNVVTADQTQELLLNGADIIKVGIGPGSVCTTRIQTGVGYPQLSAVIECADAAHGLGGLIIADGGCTCPGDVAKAFAGGADFVMLGGMLSGHVEGGGEVITKTYVTNEMMNDGVNFVQQEKQFVQFYGMSSKAANEKHFGGLKEYRSSEGREVLVPFKGEVGNTVQDLLGGIRSTCTYVGANNLKQLSKCTTFIIAESQYNSVYEHMDTSK
jgi:GMP reductase